MKTLRLMFFGVLIIQSVLLSSIEAQIYSPRRLTQRIAPQLAPGQSNTPCPAVTQPTVATFQQPADPATIQAEKDEALRKTAEFRKQRAEEAAQSPESGSEVKSPKIDSTPLVIECKKVQPDPEESLQSISLSLSNTCPKAINRVTMRLIYCDASGQKLKEWTTRRELDQALGGKRTMELIQPAYFMPWTARRVKVEVKSVRFSDGSEWIPGSN
jgi:cell fate (sporulation/competence/biofilm development) regulator YmcA (YheA/YmcA/DUF963 family)